MPNAERKLEERPDPGLVLLQDHAAQHRRRWPGTRPREAGQVPDPASRGWLCEGGRHIARRGRCQATARPGRQPGNSSSHSGSRRPLSCHPSASAPAHGDGSRRFLPACGSVRAQAAWRHSLRQGRVGGTALPLPCPSHTRQLVNASVTS